MTRSNRVKTDHLGNPNYLGNTSNSRKFRQAGQASENRTELRAIAKNGTESVWSV